MYFQVLKGVYTLLKGVSLFAVAGFLITRFYSGVGELKALRSLTDSEITVFGPATVSAAKFLAAGKICTSCVIGAFGLLGGIDTYIETKSTVRDSLGNTHTGSPIKALLDFNHGSISKGQLYNEIKDPKITAKRLAEEANETYEKYRTPNGSQKK
jgi:hypothetical protein